ncbi:MAG: hypothetical protein V9H26_04935 [Verrucomicrobiota bacterium]
MSLAAKCAGQRMIARRSPGRHRLGHCLMLVALLGATGGHWGVLQTVAWTRMLANNLQTDSLETALTKTFDGKHPCGMCKAIDAGKKSAKKTELPPAGQKLEFVFDRPIFVFTAPTTFRPQQEILCSCSQTAPRPPTPPPRAGLVELQLPA